MEQSEKSRSVRPPFSRDPRGSLEVFNPSEKPNKSPLRSQHSWKTWIEQQRSSSSNEPQSHDSISNSTPSDESANTSWMALKEPDPVAAAAQRAAGWGLVLKTDAETGTPQGVAFRGSGGGSRRDSNNSVRSSGDSSSSDGGGDRELRGDTEGFGGPEGRFGGVSADIRGVGCYESRLPDNVCECWVL